MTRALIITLALALLLCAGCAVGYVDQDEQRIVGLAVGHAKLTTCPQVPRCRDTIPQPRTECVTVQGGALSSGFSETLTTAFTAVGAYFGLGLQ